MLSSTSGSVHRLIAHASGLFGVLVFLQQMWDGAALDHVLLTATTSGLIAYLALALGVVAAQRIVRQDAGPDAAPNADEASNADKASNADEAPNASNAPASERAADAPKNAPEPQAA